LSHRHHRQHRGCGDRSRDDPRDTRGGVKREYISGRYVGGTDGRVANDEPRHDVRVVDELERRYQRVVQTEPRVSDGGNAVKRWRPHQAGNRCGE
jgi:hypothetical protein